jgi:hypothetical protein
LQLIEQWLAEQDAEDAVRLSVQDGGEPQLLGEGSSLADAVERVRERDLDVLEPQLVAAMDECAARARRAGTMYRVAVVDPQTGEPNGGTDGAFPLRHLVQGVLGLVERLEAFKPAARDLDESVIESATALRDKIREQRPSH